MLSDRPATKSPVLIDTHTEREVMAAVSQGSDEDTSAEHECIESDHEAKLPSPPITEAPQNVKSAGTCISTSISATCSRDFKSRLPKKTRRTGWKRPCQLC